MGVISPREEKKREMTTPARRRLMRDFKRLRNDPPEGISGSPQDNNILFWTAVIFGPDDTPWEGGTFKLSMEFSEDYPNKAPTVKFVSPMFHRMCMRTDLSALTSCKTSGAPFTTLR